MIAMIAMLASLIGIGGASSGLDVGFCEDNGDGFFGAQPVSQLERWQLPVDNGSHLVIRWSPAARLNGRNVTAYKVDVRTSAPVLNLFVAVYGGFPQDLCAPGGSKARAAVSVSDSKGSCSPYPARASSIEYLTSFEIPSSLRQLASWDITVTARGYGAHAPVGGKPELAQAAVFWCHKYRRSSTASLPSTPSPAQPKWTRTQQSLHRWANAVSRGYGQLVQRLFRRSIKGAPLRGASAPTHSEHQHGSESAARVRLCARAYEDVVVDQL